MPDTALHSRCWSASTILWSFLIIVFATILATSYWLGKRVLEEQFELGQQRLLVQRAQQLDTLLNVVDDELKLETAQTLFLDWADDDSLLAAMIVGPDHSVEVGLHLHSKGLAANDVLAGYSSIRAVRALETGLIQAGLSDAGGGYQLYYPVLNFNATRVLLLEQVPHSLSNLSQQTMIFTFSAMIVMLIFLLAFCLFFARRLLILPLFRITKAAKHLGAEHVEVPTKLTVTELNKLSRVLDEINLRLQRGNKQLIEKEQLYSYAIESLKAGIWDWRLDTNEVFLSFYWTDMLGYGRNEIPNHFDACEALIHPDDKPRVMQQVDDLLTGKTKHYAVPMRLRHKEGRYVWVLSKGMLVDWDEDGNPTQMVGTHIDMSEQMGPQSMVSRQSAMGTSREALICQLDGVLTHDDPLGESLLFYLDIDDFSVVNEVHGFHCGDRVLEQLELRLKTLLPEAAVVVRLVGDEMVALITDLPANPPHLRAHANSVGDRIHRSLERPFVVEGKAIMVGVTIGVTICRQSLEPETESWLSQAELALVEAKRGQLGSTCIYSDKMLQRARENLWMRDAFIQAIEKAQLVMHYWPVVDRGGEIVSAQALPYWHHPERGVIEPKDYVALLDRSGLGPTLIDFLLERTCRDLAALRRRGLTEVSLSLTLGQLLWPELIPRINKLMRENMLPLGSLNIELSESDLTKLTPEARVVLNQLQSLGVGLVVANFGAGYLAVSQLKRLNIHCIKLNVLNLDGFGSEGIKPLLVAQSQMARALDLPWMAEGVYRESSYQVLLSQDCELFQGPLFSDPKPLNSLLSMLVDSPPDDVVETNPGSL